MFSDQKSPPATLYSVIRWFCFIQRWSFSKVNVPFQTLSSFLCSSFLPLFLVFLESCKWGAFWSLLGPHLSFPFCLYFGCLSSYCAVLFGFSTCFLILWCNVSANIMAESSHSSVIVRDWNYNMNSVCRRSGYTGIYPL